MSGEDGLLAEINRKIIEEFDALWKSRGFNTAIQLAIEDTEKRVLAVLGEAEKHLRELFDKRPILLITHIVNEPISEKLFNDLMKASTEIDEYFYKAEKRVFGDKQP